MWLAVVKFQGIAIKKTYTQTALLMSTAQAVQYGVSCLHVW